MKHTFFWLAFITISAAGLVACGDDKQAAPQAPPPVAVTTYRVQEGNALYYDQYPGTVTALTETEIRPQVSGYITGIYFKDGQHVTKGQKLYSIDQQQYAASYNQAQANLDVAKSNLARAQQDADRYEELAKKDAIAKQTLDHALAELQAAKSQVNAAQANVSGVQTNLRYSTITAPFDGTIGISQVKIGSAVSAGQMVLNTLSSDNPMAVDFNVDEQQINRFVQLQKKGLNPKDSVFTLLLPGQTLYKEPGQIALIDRAIDPTTGTIKARLQFANKDNVLRPGMSCTVRVKSSGSEQQILIPYKAVVEQMGEYFVFTVGDSSKVTQHKVSLGQQIGDKVIVKEGVDGNETIVVEGVQKIREGAVVQATPDKAYTGNAADSTKPVADTTQQAKAK